MATPHTNGRRLPEWRRYMRFWGRDIERDIEDEVRFHLEMRERDYIAAGLSPQAAHEAAMARFGSIDDVTQTLRTHDFDKQRKQVRIERMEQLSQDIRYGVRKLVQAPGFTLAVILVLALGIGVNTAIFSAVDNALLRPLPFKDAERLALLERINLPSEIPGLPPEARVKRQPDINDIAGMKDVVDSWGAYAPGGLNLTGRGDPLRVRIAMATPSFFTMLGATPMLGRTFVDAEGKPDNAKVVVLSAGLWRRQFGADSSIVGKYVSLSGIPHMVVGVLPDRFAFPSGTELWMPLTVPFRWEGVARDAIHSYLPSTILLKLAPNVSIDVAEQRVRALFDPYPSAKKRLAQESNLELVMPLQQTMVRHGRVALLVLMGAAALVLLTACANVTNLLLSRAAVRRREISIRSALGASRRRIIQQLLTESLLLALTGGLLGVVVAHAGLGVLSTLMPSQLADMIPPRIDTRVLAFSLALASLTGLVFGLWPAFNVTRKKGATTINLSGGYGSTVSDGAKLRRLFVVSEMAFAVMLLIGAGLMLRSFSALLRTDTGVEVERVASVQLTLPSARYANKTSKRVFYETLLERLRTTPGIEAAAAVNEVPLSGEWGVGMSIQAEGAPPPPIGDPKYEPQFAQYLRVTPQYFQVLGMRLIAGRTFEVTDDSAHPAAVINKAMAEKLWPGVNAVGKRFAWGTSPGEKPDWVTVVGVIPDIRSQSIDEKPTMQMYFPFAESPSDFAGIVVRGSAPPRAMLSALREAVRGADPEQPTFNLQMLNDAVAKTIAPRRTNTLLIATFGLLAVVLAALGVYAVISYGVAQRTREIGIRIALGAKVNDVLRMVLREGLLLAVIGVVIGEAGAWALSRIMESMLYGVGTHDLPTFIAAPVLLLGLALCATLLPARQAARVDPMAAIRME